MLVEDYLIPSWYKPGSSVLSIRIKTHSADYKNPIILTHGRSLPYELNWDFASDDLSFADVLANKGCTVIMLNATGFGQSTKFDEMFLPAVKGNYINTFEHYYNDLSDLILWLSRTKSINKPHLVGWSSSSVPCLMFAEQNSELVSSVVSYGTTKLKKYVENWVPDEDLDNYEILTPNILSDRRHRFIKSELKETLFPTKWEEKWRNLIVEMDPVTLTGSVVQAARIYNKTDNLEKYMRWENILCPVLFLLGELDRGPQQNYSDFINKLASTYKEVKYIPNGTHFSCLETTRDALADVLKQHIEITTH